MIRNTPQPKRRPPRRAAPSRPDRPSAVEKEAAVEPEAESVEDHEERMEDAYDVRFFPQVCAHQTDRLTRTRRPALPTHPARAARPASALARAHATDAALVLTPAVPFARKPALAAFPYPEQLNNCKQLPLARRDGHVARRERRGSSTVSQHARHQRSGRSNFRRTSRWCRKSFLCRPKGAEADEKRQSWASLIDASALDNVPDRERKRQEAIFEFIQTEQSYVQSLQLTIEVPVRPTSFPRRIH